MPSPSKRILYRLLAWLGPWLIRLICFSLRISKVNNEPVEEILRRGESVLWCLWHGRMLVPMFYYRNNNVVVMISQHADGEMIARVVKKLGYKTVRGSSTRGGKEAFYELLGLLKEGHQGCMLPDGPTGPRHYFKAGTLFLAQQSQVPIIPITFAAKPCWRFKSWDQFVLPKPFAKAMLVYGDPIKVPAEITPDEVESWRNKLETTMVELVETAETSLAKE